MLIPKGWDKETLSNLFDFKNGLNKGKEFFGSGNLIVNYMDVYKSNFLTENKLKGRVNVSKNEQNNHHIKKGDVFFTRTSETINEIGLSSVLIENIENGVFSGFVLRARPKNDRLLDLFCGYCFEADYIRKQITAKSSITTRALTSGKHLGQVELLVPKIAEQQKIVDILMTWDRAIELSEFMILAKRRLKHFYIQSLYGLSSNNLIKLKEILKLGEEKNKNSLINDVYSVSNKRGLIKQSEQFGKNIASVDLKNYKIVSKNSIVYNPSRINVGSIAISNFEKKGIVSPMYVVFDTNSKVDINYFRYYLETNKFKQDIKKYFTGSVRDTLTFKDLCKIKIYLPSLEDQQKISKMFTLIDKQILLLEHELIQLKIQKKGLMQKLLTGLIRVNASE